MRTHQTHSRDRMSGPATPDDALPSNEECVTFLKWLDEADVSVSDFMASFLESNLLKTEFTDRQRQTIRMEMKKHGRW